MTAIQFHTNKNFKTYSYFPKPFIIRFKNKCLTEIEDHLVRRLKAKIF